MKESEKDIRVDHAVHREDQHFMVLTPRISHGNYYWPPCYRHGTSKCAKCERDGNEWAEQEEAIPKSTQAARDVMVSHNDKDGQEDAQNDNEPPSKKAKH